MTTRLNPGLPQAEIGIFGGSGFYELLEDATEYKIWTPYGEPSDTVAVGELGGRSVAFMARHGKNHTIAPHEVNYRANLWAFSELGVTRVIGPSACGSLAPEVAPGDFVVVDQFVDRTTGRADTFAEGGKIYHVSAADPYCPQLRQLAIESCHRLGITVHETGTVVVIQGPRFSTRAESQWFAAQGWTVINMTQYPEGYLARELEMCYVNVALITDYDAGAGADDAVTNVNVMEVFAQNIDKLKALINDMVPTIPAERHCLCKDALASAAM
ncbi:MAG: S-methyl-5'-thioadenosine phosphorylase [Coriobacteriia bacterium]|nr:S-methyl-5'-thioadenosine phosphorylase [Coriobacteriia bacterium]